MSLIEKLKAGKRNIKIIRFPGTDEDIGVTVLSEAEIQDATFETERLFKENGIEISASTLNTYNSELATRILFRVLVDVNKKMSDGQPEQFFNSIIEFKKLLTRDAKGILIEEYNAFEDECSPSPLKMGDDDFERLFESLKKNPKVIGRDLSFRMLKGLIIYLAGLHVKSQKDSGSIS